MVIGIVQARKSFEKKNSEKGKQQLQLEEITRFSHLPLVDKFYIISQLIARAIRQKEREKATYKEKENKYKLLPSVEIKILKLNQEIESLNNVSSWFTTTAQEIKAKGVSPKEAESLHTTCDEFIEKWVEENI